MAPFRYTISHPRLVAAGQTVCGNARDEKDLPLPSTTSIEHEMIEVADLLSSDADDSKITTPSPHPGPFAVQLLKSWSLLDKTMSMSQPATHMGSPASTSLANNKSDTEPPKDTNQLLLSSVIDLRAVQLTGNAAIGSAKSRFLYLPAAIRVRIYRYLFGERQNVKLYHHSNAQGITATYSKDSGTGLRFACQAIEAESWPVHRNCLQWRFMTPGPVSLSSLSRFHDTGSVRSIILPSESNVAMLDGIFQYIANLPSLNMVVVQTIGKLRTGRVPSRIEWGELMDRMQLWSGFPGRLEEVMRRRGRQYSIVLTVTCEYLPYMKGKKKFWEDTKTRTLWSSEWRIDIFRPSMTRVSNMAQVRQPGRKVQYTNIDLAGNESTCWGRGADSVKMFNEEEMVMKYAGQTGNPFKKP